MSDTELAAKVHNAAKELCAALNKAGEAGLTLSVSLAASQSYSNGSNDVRKTGWYSNISVCRQRYL